MSFALALTLASALVPQQRDEVAAWTEDVLHLVSEMERMHPDPYAGSSREEFEAAVDAFLAEVEKDGGKNATIGLMRLMARLWTKGREGHAVVWPLHARYLPLQLYRFDDGWFVVDAGAEQKPWIGARVLSIGDTPVEEACKRLIRCCHATTADLPCGSPG